MAGIHPIITATECCELCPRRCGVNRRVGRKGYCAASVKTEVYSYGLHHGEEPPVSGTRGSGTIFFSRCTLRCLYCQNHTWSQAGQGDTYEMDELVELFKVLAKEGCHNWNLVSPTPWLPAITQALESAQKHGYKLPVVYNTSGYERTEIIRELSGIVQIYLADLRYARSESAREGSDAPDYVQIARSGFLEMWNQVGMLRVDQDGIAQSGVICRLLVLPGRAKEVCENLEWLAKTVGKTVTISVMSQYTPAYRAETRIGWNRGISKEEYDIVLQAVQDLGFENGHIQDFDGQVAGNLLGFNMKPGRNV